MLAPVSSSTVRGSISMRARFAITTVPPQDTSTENASGIADVSCCAIRIRRPDDPDRVVLARHGGRRGDGRILGSGHPVVWPPRARSRRARLPLALVVSAQEGALEH